MKKTVRLLSVIFSLLLVFAVGAATDAEEIIPLAGAEDYDELGYEYNVYSGKAHVYINYDATVSGDVTVPATIDGYPVYSVDAYDNANITSLTIPEGVLYVNVNYCENLKSLTLSSTVTTLYVIDDCPNLTEITVAEGSLKYIAENGMLFNKEKTELYKCFKKNETFVTIPEGVTFVARGAFEGCSAMKVLNIPASLNEFDFDDLFYECEGIQEICVADGNKSYYSDGCALFTSDRKTLLQFYNSTASKYTVPEGVEVIDERAFAYFASLKSVKLPDTLTDIGYSAFYGCTALESVVIPDSVTEIGGYAFEGCTALKSAVLPAGLTVVESYLFDDCTSLEEVTIPEGVTSVNLSAFDGCPEITSITIPASVTRVYGHSYDSFIAEIIVDADNQNYISVDGVLFNKDKTTLVCYPAGKTDKAYTVPSTVVSIGSAAFYYNNNIESIVLPEGVENIGDSAFYGCYKLADISIPSSVVNIGSSSFDGTAFWDKNAEEVNGLYYIGSILVDADYDLPENVVVRDGTTIIARDVFRDKDMVSVTLPEGIKAIGDNAFYYCSALKSIDLPEGIKAIGDNAFYYCSALKSIDLPESVEYIGNYAFYYCSALEGIDLPESVEYIGNDAFYNCSSLETVNIPENVEYIGDSAFYGTRKLSYIFVDADNEYYSASNGVLYNKDKTELICYPAGKTGAYKMPDTVRVIGESAFMNAKLDSITLSGKLQEIAEGAFEGAQIRSEIHIPASAYLDGSAFATVIHKGYTVDENNPYYTADEYGVLYSKDMKTLFAATNNEEFTEYTIPEGVENIAPYAFAYNYYIKTINFPSTLKTAGGLAFVFAVSLETLDVPEAAFNPVNLLYAAYYNCAVKKLSVGDMGEFQSFDSGDASDFFRYYLSSLVLDEITVYDRDFDFSKVPLGKNFFKLKEGCREEYRKAFTDYYLAALERALESGGMTDNSDLAEEYERRVKACIEKGSLRGNEHGDEYYEYYGQSVTNSIYADKLYTNGPLTIRCYKGSTAESYALENGFTVIYLCEGHEEQTVKGYGATCTADGLTDGVICKNCGEVLVAQEAIPAGGHIYNMTITYPTCSAEGYTTYTCSCGDTYTSDYTDAVDHKDDNGDAMCDFCETDMSPEEEDPASKCSHICHKTGFMGFIAKIAVFFWKLFGTNPVCECGMAHY